jgi:tetratricopeptide (TPR) repeat protein
MGGILLRETILFRNCRAFSNSGCTAEWGKTKGSANMIDSSRALGWLNTTDNRSHLNKGDGQLIREIGQSNSSEFKIAHIMERLRTEAHSSGDPLRTAEIMLYCASIGHWRGWCPQAARDAIEAVISYDADDHRRAVALWILGIIQWEMSQNHEAYRNWAEARKIFKQFQNSYPRSRIANDWYQDPIEQMEVELVARPEEVSTWLNRFEPPSLGPRTWRVVNSMREKVRQQAYPSIYVLIQDLQEAIRWSERIYERAEIYLEFGLAMYQMRNSYFAIELLRKAVSDFYPCVGTYHKQVVARCILGAVEWMHKSSL